MRGFLKWSVRLGVVLLLAALGYGYLGYRDAGTDAPGLADHADALIAAGQGPADLGRTGYDMLLAVEDPAFSTHIGFDLTTPGAGATTITQSLAKREGFADFSPGLQKIRQTGYAIGLERALDKDQILALFLDSVPMGRNAEGDWTDGLFAASQAQFARPPAALTDEEFARLVAVMIAPGRLGFADPDRLLTDRIARILALHAGTCRPDGHGDVWLEGCG